MKKLSWPWVLHDSEDGSMPPTGDRDRNRIEGDAPAQGGSSTHRYDAFAPGKSVGPEEELVPQYTYSEGMTSPVSDDDDEVMKFDGGEFGVFAKLFISLLKSGSNILAIGTCDEHNLKVMANRNHNIVCLKKSPLDDINLSGLHTEAASPMFYRSRYKLDGLISSSAFKTAESAEISLRNIYNQMRPLSYGLIISENEFELEDILVKCNFKIIKKDLSKTAKFIIKKNDLDKIAVVKHYNSKKDETSTFECDVAETHQEKVSGLQVYSDLLNRCGLVFKYNKPTDVMFHMGSVRFPIDIAFLDEDNTIKKLCSNIKPGALDMFGAANIKTVLELAAGSVEAIGAEVGDKLFVNYGEQIIDRFEKESKVLESIGLEKCIYKESSSGSGAFYNLYNFNLYAKNSKDDSISGLIKNAKNYNINQNTISCYDLDSIFNSEEIRLYRRIAVIDSKRYIARGLFGETFGLGKDFIKVSHPIFLQKDFYKNINKKYSLELDGYIRRMAGNLERSKYLKQIYRDSQNLLNKISFVYKDNLNIKLATEILNSEIRVLTRDFNFLLKADFIRVPEDYNDINCLEALSERYPDHTKYMRVNSLSKAAGVPVPDHVKKSGRKVIRFIDRAKTSCSKLTDNLNKNVSVYLKLREKPDVIKSSKGEYSESCKRNSNIAKGCLINIREGIRLLASIQDISTTEEVISSIAGSAKSFSDSIKDVFDLVNVIDSEDFSTALGSATDTANISIQDLETILDRTKEYITKNILGIIILSN